MDNPEIPARFQTVMGLGARGEYYPVKKWGRLGSLVACILFLAGSVVVMFVGLLKAYQALQQHGTSLLDDTLGVPLVIAVILFLIGMLAGWITYVNWDKAVVAYERGFAYSDRKGLQTWPWDQVVSMTTAITRHYTNGIYTGTTHTYTLVNRQNRRLVLSDSIGKVEQLAKVIEDGIFPLLYEHAAGQYNLGQSLNFGPVTINKTGIAIGKKNYAWAEVKQVTIRQGFLKISKSEGGLFSGASAMVSAIPNLRVLSAILQQVVGLQLG
jgi:hypothetical protein